MAYGDARIKSNLRGFVSPHERLALSVGADVKSSSIVGGHISRTTTGEFLTNEFSGHFWQNWTNSRRMAFQNNLRGLGFDLVHTPGM